MASSGFTLSTLGDVPAPGPPPTSTSGWASILGDITGIAGDVEKAGAVTGITASTLQTGLQLSTGSPKSLLSLIPWWVYAALAAVVLLLVIRR